jgi:DNA-binding transcriptional LysR family regulator
MSVNLELRHLRAFVAVAEELHFTRAAQRLHLAQQALSSQIRQLETELDAELFYRTTRKVELAPAGEVLLGHATSVLSAVDAAWAETAKAGRGETGTLRIGYTPTLAAETLPRLVAGLREGWPGLKLSSCELWPHEAVNGVVSGLFDVGLARFPVLPDDLDCVTVREEPLGVVLGAGHRLARGDVVPVEALANDVMAIWPRDISPGFYDAVTRSFPANVAAGRVYEFENFARQGFLSDVVARIEIAAGRAFQIAFATQYEPMPESFVWRPIEPMTRIGVHLFYRSGRVTPAVSALLAAVGPVAVQEGWSTPDADTLAGPRELAIDM